MRAVTALLAGACVVLGLGAPSTLAAMYRIVESVSPLHSEALPAVNATQMRLTTPNGVTQMSPVLIGCLLTAVIVSVVAVIRARGLHVRFADTWGCGRIRQTPRMQYTSSAFAEPLRRIFSELYRPTEDLSISVHPGSRYFVSSITYTSRVVPWFEKAFYEPLMRAARAAATQVRRLQAGSVHLYLLYMAAALMAALASAWLFK